MLVLFAAIRMVSSNVLVIQNLASIVSSKVLVIQDWYSFGYSWLGEIRPQRQEPSTDFESRTSTLTLYRLSYMVPVVIVSAVLGGRAIE